MSAQIQKIRIVAERMRQVNRQYDYGGWMIALQALTIEIAGETLVIPAGHRLTHEEAQHYPGDVMLASDQRAIKYQPEFAFRNTGRRKVGA